MQGFVYYDNARTLTAMGRGRKNNVEEMKGHMLDAIGYCAKGERLAPAEGWRHYLESPCEGFWEKGERPAQGERTDLARAVQDVKDGSSVDTIAFTNPTLFHQYGRTLERVEEIRNRKRFRTEMTKGYWIWGETGVGKSHVAFENFDPEVDYVLNLDDNGWWEGYTGQHRVILNDFRGQLTYSTMLQLVDKWPHSVKRRNRAPMPFVSKEVIVTSSLPPEGIYKNLAQGDHLAQLLRRFEVIHMTQEDRCVSENSESR